MRKRPKEIKIRLTEEELEALNEKVKRAGNLNREALIRHYLQGMRIYEREPIDVPQIIILLRRAGSNLNQLLHSAYISGYAEREALKVLFQDIRTLELILYDRLAYPEKRADELEPDGITRSEDLDPVVRALLEPEPDDLEDGTSMKLPDPEEEPVIPDEDEFEKHYFPWRWKKRKEAQKKNK